MKEYVYCDHQCVCPTYKAAYSENGEDECYGDPEPCKLSCFHRSNPFESRLQEERDLIYKRLEKMVTPYHFELVVPWSDIVCLFAELHTTSKQPEENK